MRGETPCGTPTAVFGCRDRVALAALGLFTACGDPPGAPVGAQVVSAQVSGAASAAQVAPTRAIAWIEDAPDEATRVAKRERKLLVVDVWARWCEACLSVRSEVLTQPALDAFAARFVFSAIDTDKPEAAPLLARYGAHTLPTLLVLDPETGAVLALHSGSFTLTELSALLDAATRAHKGGGLPGEAALADAHAAHARGDKRAALTRYREAVAQLADATRTQALLGALDLAQELGEHAACVELVQGSAARAAQTGAAPYAVALASVRCAESLPRPEPAAAALAEARRRVDALVASPAPDASPFDIAELLALQAELRAGASDPRGARASQEQRARVLDAAAARAGSPERAQAFDHARAKTYAALGRPEDALALLRQRTTELPGSYETHGRLGTALLLDARRPKDAIEPLSRAVALAYGAPRLVYLGRLARAQSEAGERSQALATLREEVAGWQALPEGQRDDARLADARARLSALERPSH